MGLHRRLHRKPGRTYLAKVISKVFVTFLYVGLKFVAHYEAFWTQVAAVRPQLLMNSLDVSFQVDVLRKSFWTDLAAEKFRPCMKGHLVHDQLGPISKNLKTPEALLRLWRLADCRNIGRPDDAISGVRVFMFSHQVIGQTEFPVESLRARAALVGLVPIVSQLDVIVQIAEQREALGANVAPVGTFIGVKPLDVQIVVVFPRKAFQAEATLDRPQHLVKSQIVLDQLVGLRKAFLTKAANERPQVFVNRPGMSPQLGIKAEALLADGALEGLSDSTVAVASNKLSFLIRGKFNIFGFVWALGDFRLNFRLP